MGRTLLKTHVGAWGAGQGVLGMPRRDLSIEEKDLKFSLRCPHLEQRRSK